MDFGSGICKPRNPYCEECPLIDNCKAYNNNRINDYPVKMKTKKIPHFNVAVGVIWKNNNILITRRKSKGLLPGLWEFPGGKLNQNESAEDCLIREIYEETGMEVELKAFISNIKHQYSHFSISLDSFHCIYKNGAPKSDRSSNLKWVLPKDI